jgi:acid stress chaperone HdeB
MAVNPKISASPFAIHNSRVELQAIESNTPGIWLDVQVSFTTNARKTRWRRFPESGHVGEITVARMEMVMKTMSVSLFAAALLLASAPAHAVVLDLSTMTCKQFIEGGDDEIKMVLTWMDGWYKGDEDEAIIDTDVFVANAKKFGTFCAANPSISIVNAAEKILGK